MDEIFDSLVRSAEDLAGVFEFDGEVSYFYLYRVEEDGGGEVLGSIRISRDEPPYSASDLQIRWSPSERFVGLEIFGKTWAVFDVETGATYGGNFASGKSPVIPAEILTEFAPGH